VWFSFVGFSAFVKQTKKSQQHTNSIIESNVGWEFDGQQQCNNNKISVNL